MKIQKKLLFLLCTAFISTSYGMLDEEKVKQDKIEFYAPLFKNGKDDIKDITSQSVVSAFKGNLVYLSPKNHPFAKQFEDEMNNLELDTLLTTNNLSCSFINLKRTLTRIDNYVQWRINNSVQKQKSFWEQHPLPCLTLAFLAGGCITLKIYNTFYGKQ